MQLRTSASYESDKMSEGRSGDSSALCLRLESYG